MTRTETNDTTDSKGLTRQFSKLIVPNKAWLAACSLITLVGTLLRFYWLELKPMHHDEGVNGHFLTRLFREGIYQYDPANYHGPDLYYITLAFTKVFGLNTWTVRASVGIFGVLTVVLAFYLRRYLGTVGSLAAALFLSLSPGMVYISRYFIHEILFIFFSLSFVVAVLFFIEKRKAGLFATGWMTLLLLVCFLPTALNLATFLGGESETQVWALRVGILLVEAVLIFFVMRMFLSWDEGRPIYFILASASLVLLFATKETAFITVGTMLIACILIWGWQKLTSAEAFAANRFTIQVFAHGVLGLIGLVLAFVFFDRVRSFNNWLYINFASPDLPDQRFVYYSILFLVGLGVIAWVVYFLDSKLAEAGNKDRFFDPSLRLFREKLGNVKNAAFILFAGIFVFVYIGVLFFSSFFTYPDGIKGAFEAYAIWSKTGSTDHTQNGTAAYFKWMMQVESPLVVLSVLGTLIAFLKARHRFAMFAGLWALGLFLAYTIIPYKTPWLALSFTLPMCIIAGYAFNELWISKQRTHKAIAVVLGLLSVFILLFQTYDLNFKRYDSDRLPYVYAHTERGYLELISEIERYAIKSAKEKQATIEIVSPDYWPMPWELRNYPRANFHGRIVNANASEMIVASSEQREELAQKYAAHYKYAGTYPLRPGVELYLLVRRDIAGPETKEIGTVAVSSEP